MVLDPDSAEHWLAVQEFRQEMDGAHPDDLFGAGNYVLIRHEDGRLSAGLTEAGLRRIEGHAVQFGGAGELARLDQIIAGVQAQQRTHNEKAGMINDDCS